MPPIVLFFAKHSLVGNYDMSFMNQIVSGAAPLGGGVVTSARERANCDLIQQTYCLTEASPVTHIMACSLATKIPSSVVIVSGA